jgi:hypothetical protein
MDVVALRPEKEKRVIMFVVTGPESNSIAKKNMGGKIPESQADDRKSQLSKKPDNYGRTINRARYFSRRVNGNDISLSQPDHPQSKLSIAIQEPRSSLSSIEKDIWRSC